MEIYGRFDSLSELNDVELPRDSFNALELDDDERLLLLFAGLARTSNVDDLVEAADEYLRDC